jgi:phage repressor protein C with HTH and peptisase S24 domain
MDNSDNTVKGRLKAYLSANNITMAEFGRRIGVSSAYITSMRKSIQPDKVERIKEEFPDLDIDWLLTGVKDDNSPPIKTSDTILVPVASPDSIGGTRFNEEVNTEEYINGYLPFPTSIAHQGDVVIPIYGDSMEPTYKAGSMVLIREVELWREYLELGCTYVIGLVDDRRIIKTVMAGSDTKHLLLVSINPAYEPQEIDKKIIRSVWRVIVSVRRETL